MTIVVALLVQNGYLSPFQKVSDLSEAHLGTSIASDAILQEYQDPTIPNYEYCYNQGY
jgi:hypothetical protein